MPRMGRSLRFSRETVANWVCNSIHQREACACGYFVYKCVEGVNVAVQSSSDLSQRVIAKLFKKAHAAEDPVLLRTIAYSIYNLVGEVEGGELSTWTHEGKVFSQSLSIVTGSCYPPGSGKEQLISKIAQQVKEEIRACSVSLKFVEEWVMTSVHQPKVYPCGHYIYVCVEAAHGESSMCNGVLEKICIKIMQRPLAEDQFINVGSIAKAICELIGEGEALSVNLHSPADHQRGFLKKLSSVTGVRCIKRGETFIMEKIVQQLQEEFRRIGNPVYVSTVKDDETVKNEDELAKVNPMCGMSQRLARECDVCFIMDTELLRRVFAGQEVSFCCRRWQTQSCRISLIDDRSGFICGDGYMSIFSGDSLRAVMEKSPKHKQGISRASGSPMSKGKNHRFMRCIFTMVEVRKYHAQVPLGASCHVIREARREKSLRWSYRTDR